MVVDPVPTICCWVCLTVAPTKPVTQPKKVAAKGKGVSHPATQPWAHKLTWVVSSSPAVAEVKVPAPPVTCLSWPTCLPLFEEPAMSGDEDIRKVTLTTSGKWSLTTLP